MQTILFFLPTCYTFRLSALARQAPIYTACFFTIHCFIRHTVFVFLVYMHSKILHGCEQWHSVTGTRATAMHASRCGRSRVSAWASLWPKVRKHTMAVMLRHVPPAPRSKKHHLYPPSCPALMMRMHVTMPSRQPSILCASPPA